MTPGKFASISETHFGVGEFGNSYILHPGVGGLIIENYHDVDILLLLVGDDLVEVRSYAVEVLDEQN